MTTIPRLVQPSAPYRFMHDPPHWPPAPPQDEDPADASARLDNERRARMVSEEIDRALAVERQKRKKKKEAVRILLLGQAESGKSTTLKNFQLQFAPKAFYADAESWRTVIHLNLVRSVNFVLDVLNSIPAGAPPTPRPPTPGGSPYGSISSMRTSERPKTSDGPRAGTSRGFGTYAAPINGVGGSGRGASGSGSDQLSPELRRLKLSLLPLKSIEATLNKRLATIPRPQAAMPFPLSAPPASLDASTFASPPPPSATARSLRRSSSSRVRRLSLPSSLSAALAPSGIASAGVDVPEEPGTRPRRLLSPSRRPSASESRPRSSTSSSSSSSSSSGSSHTHSSISPTSASASSSAYTAPASFPAHLAHRRSLSHLLELSVRVRSGSNWKRLARIPGALYSSARGRSGDSELDPEESAAALRELRGARAVIEACGEDMHALWTSPDVQAILRRSDITLQNEPGFFLNDALRVTASDYVPTANDILRARLCTIGVEEHRIKMETGPEKDEEWVIYDCGGSRSQRAVWAPFFDSVNAIIFLAPISAFDEKLAEDPSVNRLQDTIQLWRAVCANRLLANVEIILFLNKCDVLKAKLRAGIRFAHYCTTYDDRKGTKNDMDSVARYVLSSFQSVHKQFSPRPRKLHAYLTSVIDSRATSKVLGHVRELVMVGHLTESNIL